MRNYSAIIFLLLIILMKAKSFYCWTKPGRDLMFNKFGEFGSKQFFIPKYQKVYWHEAQHLCKEFGMELARLDTAAEAGYVFGIMATYGDASYAMHIDGVATSPGQKTGWYWVKTKLAIDYPMTWAPTQPDNYQGDQPCLSLTKINGVVGFDDIGCYASDWSVSQKPKTFLCQIKRGK